MPSTGVPTDLTPYRKRPSTSVPKAAKREREIDGGGGGGGGGGVAGFDEWLPPRLADVSIGPTHSTPSLAKPSPLPSLLPARGGETFRVSDALPSKLPRLHGGWCGRAPSSPTTQQKGPCGVGLPLSPGFSADQRFWQPYARLPPAAEPAPAMSDSSALPSPWAVGFGGWSRRESRPRLRGDGPAPCGLGGGGVAFRGVVGGRQWRGERDQGAADTGAGELTETELDRFCRDDDDRLLPPGDDLPLRRWQLRCYPRFPSQPQMDRQPRDHALQPVSAAPSEDPTFNPPRTGRGGIDPGSGGAFARPLFLFSGVKDVASPPFALPDLTEVVATAGEQAARGLRPLPFCELYSDSALFGGGGVSGGGGVGITVGGPGATTVEGKRREQRR